MKATHIDYKHPRHLRVVTGKKYSAWNAARGIYEEDSLCVNPGAQCYKSLYKSNLPKWSVA